VILEGGTAPNVVPDRAVADFYIRYPDSEYLAQVREMVDNAPAPRLWPPHEGQDRSFRQPPRWHFGIHSGRTRVRISQEVRRDEYIGRSRQADGYEETGSVSRDIPGVEFSAQTSTAPNHTYEMEADTIADIGHKGFVTDAQAMAATLFDFATTPTTAPP